MLQFPEEIKNEKIKGTVFLYRPSNEHLDFDFPLVLSGSNLLIPDERLLDGRWNITVDWEYENTRPYEFDRDCENWEFREIPQGVQLLCYPERRLLEDLSLIDYIHNFVF